MYHPDVNESVMLIEALEKAVQKTLSYRSGPAGKNSAQQAKMFVQNAYLIANTYNSDIISNAITKIIDSDIQMMEDQEKPSAGNALKNQLDDITQALDEVYQSLTSMYRSVPIHYRVGYMFRDANAKSSKAKIADIKESIIGEYTAIDTAYLIK